MVARELIGQIPSSPASADSVRTQKSDQESEIQGPITYEAQDFDILVKEQKMILLGRAKVTYLDMTLTAAKITVDWEKDLMTAEGVWDTVWVKEVSDDGDSVQTVRYMGAPQFSESGDVLTGEVMVYNFRTRKGRVLRGRTAYEDGFYTGNTLKIVKPNSLNVADATYTSCDKEEPHFHFWSQKMKIDVDEKLIAKPLVMYVGKIPVLALPFAYFPIRKGRHSGVLIPRYGESTLEGRYLRGLGYYWAASDYWDVKGTVDYYENSGFLFRGDLRYNLRYRLQGAISGSWTRKDFEVYGTKERRWDLAIRHSQTISPTMSLAVSGQFVSSGNFYRDVSANLEQRLQQEIRSNAKLTKKWGTTGKAEITLNQTRYLKTDQISELLPQVTISNRVASLIPKPEARRGQEQERRWYHDITIPYDFNILMKRSRQKSADGVVAKKDGIGMDHSLGMYVSPTLFGWLRLQPKISVEAWWLDRRKEYYVDPETNAIQSRDKKGFFMHQTFNTSVSANTKIYGLFQPKFLKNVMIRHVASPNISFSWRPDFSEDKYGYYQTVVDTQGVEYRRDRYSGGLFGSTPTGESQSMRFGLDNVFQMKVGDGEKEKKIDLFMLNFSSAYNWKAEQYRLSDLRSTLRANPSRNISLDVSATHSFYQTDENGNRVNRLYMDEIRIKDWKTIFTKRWVRMTNFSVNLNLRLQGRARSGMGSDAGMEGGQEGLQTGMEGLENLSGDRLTYDETVSGFDIPWNLTTRLSYTINRYNPLNPSKKFWMDINFDFNLTKNWKISYKSQWDFIEKEPVRQDFIFKRDLHCWEAMIAWTPTGYNKRFYFRINVKAPMLRELKFEKGAGRRGFTSTPFEGYF